MTSDIQLREKFQPYSSTEIKAPSSPLALKLAAHLRSLGAKICLDRKQHICWIMVNATQMDSKLELHH
ncbi:hypothetical protein Hdeb2414_s0003g00108321 [Helianthus debilis subsp. tardiflorus]